MNVRKEPRAEFELFLSCTFAFARPRHVRSHDEHYTTTSNITVAILIQNIREAETPPQARASLTQRSFFRSCSTASTILAALLCPSVSPLAAISGSPVTATPVMHLLLIVFFRDSICPGLHPALSPPPSCVPTAPTASKIDSGVLKCLTGALVRSSYVHSSRCEPTRPERASLKISWPLVPAPTAMTVREAFLPTRV